MFYKKKLDFIDLIWEYLAYQIENKDFKKQNKMYPRFTKAIINHFLTKNPSISMRNRMFMHTARDDTILGILKFISKHDDIQVYGALLPKAMMNPAMLNSKAFKTYFAIATGVEPPNSKRQKKFNSTISSAAMSKKKAPVKVDTSKGLKVVSKVDLSEEAQLKKVIKRSKKYFHIFYDSGSSDGTDEGTSTKPGVPDEPKHISKSKKESWGDSNDEDDDDNDENVSKSKSDGESDNNADDANDNDGDEQINDDDNDDDDEEKNKKEDGNYEDLYGDVNVNLRKKEEDAHVTLTAVHDAQKTEGTQSSSVSINFTSKLLNLENVSPAAYTIASVMDTIVHQTSSIVITTTPIPPPSFVPPTQ
uniref:Uncharacterized protein n=1 Tax=Tanacetum cinerariifolium TaxID=118510 RepID=A0A6L2MH77_TANCI|nr:hypothetical protein [Tanacetum cinerariifolium]